MLLTAISSLMLLTGCASINGTFRDKYPYEQKTYIGIRTNTEMIFKSGYFWPILLPWGVLEFPLSMVIDTLLLPYTITSDIENNNRKISETTEKDLALKFVKANQRISELSRGQAIIRNDIRLTNSHDYTNGRYEFRVEYPTNEDGKSKATVFAIIDIDRRSKSFTLACITDIASHRRDMNKPICGQAPLLLPKQPDFVDAE